MLKLTLQIRSGASVEVLHEGHNFFSRLKFCNGKKIRIELSGLQIGPSMNNVKTNLTNSLGSSVKVLVMKEIQGRVQFHLLLP